MPYADPDKRREQQRRYRLANPEKIREYNKRYVETHPDVKHRNIEATNKWRATNKEKVKELNKQYRAAHINKNPHYLEKCRERARAYYWKDPEKSRAANKIRYELNKYREDYKLVRRVNCRRRRSRLIAAGTFTAEDIRLQFKLQTGLCYYCYLQLNEYHIEHKTPISRGGSNYPDNLVCSCPLCNYRKGTKTSEEFIKSAGVKSYG